MLLPSILFLVGLAGGFVDAIAGGGGLLTLPAFLLTGLNPYETLATNKGQSVFGSSMALGRYFRSPLLDRKRARQSFIPGLIGAALGVLLMLRIKLAVLTPLVMILLAAVAIFMIVYKPPRITPEPRQRSLLLAIAVAFFIAFYDGFFGPGTGTFLIIAYAFLWRDSLDAASANAKVVNFASNLASLLVFIPTGLIRWKLALPMAAGQMIGGYLGAHVTIRVGRHLVRRAVILVSLALLASLVWRTFLSPAAPPPPPAVTRPAD